MRLRPRPHIHRRLSGSRLQCRLQNNGRQTHCPLACRDGDAVCVKKPMETFRSDVLGRSGIFWIVPDFAASRLNIGR